jgi:ANTAR domain
MVRYVQSPPSDPPPAANGATEPGQQERVIAALRSAAEEMARGSNLRDVDSVLDNIVVHAVETVPGADAGGITVAEDAKIESSHTTAHAIGELDQLQTELNEGPCIEAATNPPSSGVVVIDDLAGDDAQLCPRYAKAAVDAGYRSMCSTQLAAGHAGYRAALNLYSATPAAFTTEAQLVAALFGAQAAVLLYGSETAAHLTRAIDSRDVIGRAKGVLIERFGVDDSEAFQMLVKSSQDTNLKLVKVAGWLCQEAVERGKRGAGRGTSCG